MDKRRIVIGVILSLFILIMIFLMFKFGDNLFLNKFNITYPDGCQESYINDKLTSNECTIGRMMSEEQKKRSNITVNEWNPSTINIQLNSS